MKCCKPVQIWKNRVTKKNQFKYDINCHPDPILVNCGKCSSCRDNYKVEIGIRGMYELADHSEAMCLTLTVADEYINEVFPSNSLDHTVYQKFMKRFRKKLETLAPGVKIRPLLAGEYGAKYGRPHFHVIIFGYKFKDLFYHKTTGGGPQYRSPILESLWYYGYSSVGHVNAKTFPYIVKYVAKHKGEPAKDRPLKFDPHSGQVQVDSETGEYLRVKKPYLIYPRGKEKGGLGYTYYKQHAKAIFKKGYITLPSKRGKEEIKVSIPRYFKKKFKEEYPKEYQDYLEKMVQKVDEAKQKYIKQRIIQKATTQVLKEFKQAYRMEVEINRHFEKLDIKKRVQYLDMFLHDLIRKNTERPGSLRRDYYMLQLMRVKSELKRLQEQYNRDPQDINNLSLEQLTDLYYTFQLSRVTPSQYYEHLLSDGIAREQKYQSKER